MAQRTPDIPLKRFGTPEEFANMVVFLASGRASYVTGQRDHGGRRLVLRDLTPASTEGNRMTG